MTLEIIGVLEKYIINYCKLNNIDNIEDFSKRCLQLGFNITKFGINPKDNIDRENQGIIDNNPKIEEEKSIVKKTRITKKKENKVETSTVEIKNTEEDNIIKEEIKPIETPNVEAKKPTIRRIKITKKS